MARQDQTIIASDPVTFEVVRGGLYAICEEMKSVMTRAAFSPLLSLSADLSCALLDADGDVEAEAPVPEHNPSRAVETGVRERILERGDDIGLGDGVAAAGDPHPLGA